MRYYARAAGFRNLASELGVNPAILAHRYALSLGIDTLYVAVPSGDGVLRLSVPLSRAQQ